MHKLSVLAGFLETENEMWSLSFMTNNSYPIWLMKEMIPKHQIADGGKLSCLRGRILQWQPKNVIWAELMPTHSLQWQWGYLGFQHVCLSRRVPGPRGTKTWNDVHSSKACKLLGSYCHNFCPQELKSGQSWSDLTSSFRRENYDQSFYRLLWFFTLEFVYLT